MNVMNVTNVTNVPGLMNKVGELTTEVSALTESSQGALRERSVNSVCSVVRQIPGRFVSIRVIRGQNLCQSV